MIKTRFKQTEALTQVEGFKSMIESQEVILAELELPEIIDMPTYNQVLRIKDVNVATSVEYVKLSPKRVLVHKVTGKELKLDLFVPDWTITKDNVSSYINELGERVMFEREYYNDETEEVVTTEVVMVPRVDENGEQLRDDNGDLIVDEVTQDLPELEPEAYLLPTIPYLMFITKQIVLPDLIQLFSAQFIQDNFDIWSNLEGSTHIAKP
jgi:hypothetical protein